MPSATATTPPPTPRDASLSSLIDGRSVSLSVLLDDGQSGQTWDTRIAQTNALGVATFEGFTFNYAGTYQFVAQFFENNDVLDDTVTYTLQVATDGAFTNIIHPNKR